MKYKRHMHTKTKQYKTLYIKHTESTAIHECTYLRISENVTSKYAFCKENELNSTK